MNKKSFLIIIFLSFFTNAYADLNGAEAYVNKTTQEIFKITTQSKSVPVIREELVEYIKSNIDIKWMSKFVLGKSWRKASDTQKNKFINLFEQYLIYNYAPKFQGYKNEKYKINKTTEIAPGKYISKISLILSDSTNLLLDVFILEKDGDYKIVDVSGEGISFAATQRAEFGSMIGMHGLDKFLVILEEKVKSLKENYIDAT